ncbi:MAG: Rieske (2Fe-2S) protein [Mycobacteriales bacterium]
MAVDRPISRRSVLATGAAGLGVVVLAGCGSSGAKQAAPKSAQSGSGAIAGLADIPVGGAISAHTPNGQQIIVAQPTAGQVVAFSAICTHRGCQVAPQGKELNCPCHGSKYNALTGAVINGPALHALPKVAVRVESGRVVPG